MQEPDHHPRRRPVRAGRGRAVAVVLAVALAAGCSSGGSAGSGASSGAGSPGAASSGTASGGGGTFAAATRSRLKSTVDGFLTEAHVPGAVVMAWTKDATWTYPTGKADVATGRPMVAGEISPIRSVTKSFTVTLVLQLVDQGKIDLDATVDRYLPGFRDGSRITVRQLAGMTSGLPDYTNQKLIDLIKTDPTASRTPEQLLAFSADEPLDFPPGTSYSYSNANTIVLGLIVEKVTGQPFAEVLQRQILGPLHLTHTEFLDGNQAPSPHPEGYSPDPETGAPQADPAINYSLFSFAGAMVSTAADLRTWAGALVSGKLLKPETQAQRLQGRKPLDGPEYDLYGLGIGQIDGWWGHTGNGLGFTAGVLQDPKTGDGVVILFNGDGDGDGPAHLAKQLIPIISGAGG